VYPILADPEFISIWNAAGSLAAVVAGVSEGSTRPVPRWAVLARATAMWRRGGDLKHHELRCRAG
jgi:hypothetical protein